MKFVYVIVGSEDNFFLEQSLISIYTLRKHNPHAYISLLIDDGTAKLITKYKSPILSYTNEILTPTLPNGLLPIQKSRFLKTSQRKLLRGKLLYIDNDTFITGSLKELEDLDYDIAAVANKHGYYDKLGSHPMNKHYQKVTGISPEKDLKIRNFVNNGVIFSSDTDLALDFFDMWHYLWWKTSSEKGFHKDQIEIWHTNVIKGNILKKLNDNYNCQLVYPKECLPYLPTAKIFHYFSSTDHISHLTLKNKLFLYELRKNGITEKVELVIDNLVKEYYEGLEVIMDLQKNILFSPISKLSIELLKRKPRVHNFFNKFSDFILNTFYSNQ